jgi:mono/diheme cytochrome c family protein
MPRNSDHPRRRVFFLLMGAGSLIVLGAGAGAVVLLSGVMNTAATRQHFQLTHRVLDVGLEYAVRAAARNIEASELDSPAMRARGAACYEQHCVACHGAPGIPPEEFARGMLPVPVSLMDAAKFHPPEWLYYVTRKGVRMTGMPAWEYRLSDESLWSVVAFLQSLPHLDAAGYRDLADATRDTPCEPRTDLPPPEEGADVLLRQYACHSCHRIDGVVGPRIATGPPLTDWPRRAYIAGVLPNTEQNLARWIMDPRAISPQTLMPDMGVAPEHADAMARFLFAGQ